MGANQIHGLLYSIIIWQVSGMLKSIMDANTTPQILSCMGRILSSQIKKVLYGLL